MGLLGSTIAGMAQGAGEAGVAVGKQWMAEDAATRLKDMEAEIQRARDDRLHGFAQELQKSGASLQQETYAANTETDIKAAPRKIQAQTPAMVEQQSALLPGEVEKRRQFAAVDTQEKVNEFSQLEPLKRKAAIDTAVEQLKALSTPEMLKAERNIALAKHIVDPSYVAVSNEDGTVTMVNSRNPKDAKALEVDGVKVVQKNPEARLAAVSVINMVTADKRTARLEHQTALANSMGDKTATDRANAEWKAAEVEADRRVAPALAVLYEKAGVGQPESKPETALIPAPKAGEVVDGNVFKGGDPRDKNNWKQAPIKDTAPQPGASLYGSSGSHDSLIDSPAPSSVQRRINELQTRLDNNVNTTLEGKRRDETELQMILAKRNTRYQGSSQYDQNSPAIWNK